MSIGIVEYIDPRKLHRDQNQPRQPDWESDEVKEDLQKLADSYHGDPKNQIWQIKVDENNTVRLGERRWRAALMVGLPSVKVERVEGLSELEWFRMQTEDDEYKVLHSEMDKAWSFGRWLIKIVLGKDYSLDQLKSMEHQELVELLDLRAQAIGQKKAGTKEQTETGIAELARQIRKNDVTVGNYIQCLYLEPETQKIIGRRNGHIPYSYARVVVRLYPDHLKEKSKVEQLLRDGKFKSRELLETYIETYFEEVSKQAGEKVKELEEEEKKVKPEPKEEKPKEESKEELPEPEPEDKVVETEANRLLREKNEARTKLISSLYISDGKGSSLEGKIQSSETEGVDENSIEKWKEQFTAYDSKNFRDGDYSTEEMLGYCDEIRERIKDIDAERKELKKQKERERIEEDERKRLREEVKEELMLDEDFREEVAEEQVEKEREKLRAEMGEVVGDVTQPDVTEEELEEYERAKQEYYDSLGKVMSSTVIQKRGRLFRNWWNHASVRGVISELTCPDCGTSSTIGWTCCNLSFDKAMEAAKKKYEESVKGD